MFSVKPIFCGISLHIPVENELKILVFGISLHANLMLAKSMESEGSCLY